jgi:hypothetical protein
MSRQFHSKPAKREECPLIISVVGQSGSGKTYSGLRLATGIARARGGDVVVIDTEALRALAYADQFKFQHIPFSAPFSPRDYKAAIEYALTLNPGCILVESMTHEHSGEGGVLWQHDDYLDRKAGDDWQKRERLKLLAWKEPKAQRNELKNFIIQIGAKCPLVLTYRASEKLDFTKKDGTDKPREMGFRPETTSDLIYEMTAQFLLLPGSDGCPTFQSDRKEERAMIKMPAQFRGWFTDGVQLSEEIGERLAHWAKGDTPTSPQDAPQGATPDKYRDDAGEVCAAIMDASSLDIVAQIFQSFNAINKEYSPADRKLIIQAKDEAKARLSE